MVLRRALVAGTALLVLGACTAPAAVAPASGAPSPAAPSPAFTPVPSSPGPATPSPSPRPTPSPDAGNVGGSYPELTAERTGADALIVSLVDPAAKAWRVVIAGAGLSAGDRFEIVVESGDVEPVVEAREVRDGVTKGVIDLTGFAGDPTAAVGGCHGTLGACVGSDGFRLPADGDGMLVVRLSLLDSERPITIVGGTARWPGEPFALGPWTDTEPFAWPAG